MKLDTSEGYKVRLITCAECGRKLGKSCKDETCQRCRHYEVKPNA